MNSIVVTAPAKVNLFLKILSKRKDSYHNLLTLFERISLTDTIKISKAPRGIAVKSDKFITRSQKENIVYKAAEMILRQAGVSQGVKIEIKKRIPIAAGLGGGSSDAASVLIGINKLFRLRLDDKTLIAMGKKLGADVPFFVLNTAFAIGVGRPDSLKTMKSRSRLWHLLINPGFKVATKDVYRAFDASKTAVSKCLTHQPGDVKIISPLNLRMEYACIESALFNDLEAALVSKKYVIGSILKGLAHLLGKKAIVSGSGPSLFCLYRTRKEAIEGRDAILKRIPARSRHGWKIFVVDTY